MRAKGLMPIHSTLQPGYNIGWGSEEQPRDQHLSGFRGLQRAKRHEIVK